MNNAPNTTSNNAPNTNTSLSPFYVACRDNDITKLRELLQTLSIGEMNNLEPNGSTGLHVACFRGHREIVKLLLEKGVSRRITNRFKCFPYQEAASIEIQQLFSLIPEQNRYVANSGRVEWLLLAPNTQATAARHLEALKQHENSPIRSATQRIIDKYIEPHFRDIQNYDELLRHFTMALEEEDPKYFVKAYTAETGFYSRLNVHLAEDHHVGRAERNLYVGILAFNPYFERYRFNGSVHRGMRLTEDELGAYQVGQTVMVKSFLSASTDRGRALNFINDSHRSNIHGTEVKMGVICTYIIQDRQNSLDVHALSEFSKEKEVLIFPYSVFTVDQICRGSESHPNQIIDIILTQ